MTISKKVRQYKKILSHKKHIGGAEKKPKSNEFNIQTNYNGPLITPALWSRFLSELRMGTGFNLTNTISTILNDPFLSICRSTAIIRTNHNPHLNSSLLENTIMISCDKNIPHYYAYKPHIINLIRQVVLKGDFDHTKGELVPLKVGINLFIQNGDVLEHEIISDQN
jgi:hypothetical protein